VKQQLASFTCKESENLLPLDAAARYLSILLSRCCCCLHKTSIKKFRLLIVPATVKLQKRQNNISGDDDSGQLRMTREFLCSQHEM